jgi:uncharacterized membrane protein YfcA
MPSHEIRVQIAGAILAFASIVVVVELVRRRRLTEWQSIVWLAAAAAVGGFAAFRRVQFVLADFVGIYYPPVLILAAFVFGGLVILLLQSVALTSLEDRNRRLAQSVALLGERLDRLEDAKRPAPGTGDEP